ncbi:MAG: hypothetical protein R2942_17375 [Ignavibacteria bacterium]
MEHIIPQSRFFDGFIQ